MILADILPRLVPFHIVQQEEVQILHMNLSSLVYTIQMHWRNASLDWEL